MAQETLEEAAENWLYELENTNPIVVEKRYPLIPMKFGFIEGAKWQKEKFCNHDYILTTEKDYRVIKCRKCNDTRPI